MIIGISGKLKSGKDTVAKMIQLLDSGEYTEKESLIAIIENDIIADQSKWKVKKFADKIKDFTCSLINCTREDLENEEFKDTPLGEEWDRWAVYSLGHLIDVFNTQEELLSEYPRSDDYDYTYETMTPRLLMQLLGTECGRKIIHPNVWINGLFADYVGKKRNDAHGQTMDQAFTYPDWLISDVRFPDEAQAIRDRGGLLIRVKKGMFVDTRGGERFFYDLCEEAARRESERTGKPQHISETALDHWKDEDWDHVIYNTKDLNHLLKEVRKFCKLINLI